MEAASFPDRDWSGLPEDLIALVILAVDIPDLFRAGAVCTSWRAASLTARRVRAPAAGYSPCLLYSCGADDPDTATIYRTSDGEYVEQDYDFFSAACNDSDGLFYLLADDCSIFTLDLNGTAPIMEKILQGNDPDTSAVRSIVFAPWGDILQVWRILYIDEYGGQVYTDEIELYKADFDGQKLVKIRSSGLRGHALFLGFNSTMLISPDDFLRLEPNHAYITEDYWEDIGTN